MRRPRPRGRRGDALPQWLTELAHARQVSNLVELQKRHRSALRPNIPAAVLQTRRSQEHEKAAHNGEVSCPSDECREGGGCPGSFGWYFQRGSFAVDSTVLSSTVFGCSNRQHSHSQFSQNLLIAAMLHGADVLRLGEPLALAFVVSLS
ncbi:uncharacterized protein LOC108432946 isoform X1 [Pygocentrus nattereri]|uniref:uncharacterized protein LOC108432946 isoform X1 n=1 Tax=Pygocentrus nattereri TaxID=42514 RepID=UPI001890CE70|nr:uncharacterized protein LOC108432946 isoform X1 [Pygocentrus nattereri]